MSEQLAYVNKGTLSICCEMRLREDMEMYQSELSNKEVKDVKEKKKRVLSDFV
jgi:hypothetical protein